MGKKKECGGKKKTDRLANQKQRMPFVGKNKRNRIDLNNKQKERDIKRGKEKFLPQILSLRNLSEKKAFSTEREVISYLCHGTNNN